jgi:hypothetical protein
MSSGVFRLDIISDDKCLSEIPWSNDDCNANASPDGCDLATGREGDCDRTGIPDSCELAAEVTFDCDSDALPDHCEPPVQTLAVPQQTLRFGYAVAIDGDDAFVGEPSIAPDTHVGRVHWFHREQDAWSHVSSIPSPTAAPHDQFGAALAVAPEWLFVGAPSRPAVYAFPRVGMTFGDPHELPLPKDSGILFGVFLAAYGHRAVVADGDFSSYATRRIWAYVYCFNGEEWVLEAVLTPSALPGIHEWIRSPVDIWDRWIALNTEPISIFRRTGDHWIEQPPVEFYPTAKEQSSGTSLALQDDLLVVADCRFNERVFVPFRRVGRTWTAEPEIAIASGCDKAMSMDIGGPAVAMIAPTAEGLAVVLHRSIAGWAVELNGIGALAFVDFNALSPRRSLIGHDDLDALVGLMPFAVVDGRGRRFVVGAGLQPDLIPVDP